MNWFSVLGLVTISGDEPSDLGYDSKTYELLTTDEFQGSSWLTSE
jgi:hypothetical protein